ncbi:oxidoreductase [Mycolicibacterium aichiense]|uniref:2-dehydropantoate 2-reductase n=1 Tax=Mycolicibacterium aichiense TaxID=1799 RepID=A0AAD1HLT3_9MYCO|nr:oxidoreductase [Mycolicibacterium aichiense]BBX07451.1 putative 2-dehydropantoate 2-reductase [Mycolicibacterium aichiense]
MGTSIALVGPGAIGSTVAAVLHAAGHAVTVCGHTPRDQIEVRPDDQQPIVVPGPVLTDPAGIDGPVDLVFLAVKDSQNEQAAGWLERLCDDHTVVCVLQNGVEQVERVGPFCPSAHIVPAVVWFSAERQPDGWVRLRTEARLVLPDSADAETLAAVLRSTEMIVELDPDFTTAAWRKLLFNALAGFMVLARRRSGMFRRADIAALARRYLAECVTVARAEGARLPDSVIDEVTDMFAAAPEDLTTSMLTDAEARRRLEWDIRNNVIVRKAAGHGLDTPVGDVLVPLLAAASDGPG